MTLGDNLPEIEGFRVLFTLQRELISEIGCFNFVNIISEIIRKTKK
jgi:hypothetical protein